MTQANRLAAPDLFADDRCERRNPEVIMAV
jgi:hypothetical protein